MLSLSKRKELIEQKNRIDLAYMERIKLMETVLERKFHSKLDEQTRKLNQEMTEQSAELAKAHERADKLTSELRAREHELSQARLQEAALNAQLTETRQLLTDAQRDREIEVKRLNLDLMYAQENLKSAQFDFEQLNCTYKNELQSIEQKCADMEKSLAEERQRYELFALSLKIKAIVYKRFYQLKDYEREFGESRINRENEKT